MGEDETWSGNEDRAVAAGIAAVSQLGPFLDTLDSMVAQVQSRGFTGEQSRAIVATVFGWRPPTEGA